MMLRISSYKAKSLLWQSRKSVLRAQSTAAVEGMKDVKTKVGIVGGGPVGLLMSKLFCDYHIPHVLIERRSSQRHHPQAHYINARSMEVLRCHSFDDYHDIIQEAAPSFTWRDFVYGHSVTGAEFCRQDHFHDTPAEFWSQSPTTVMHLAQNKFESIQLKNIRKHVQFGIPTSSEPAGQQPYYHLYGYNAELIDRNKDHSTLLLHPFKSTDNSVGSAIRLQCDYIISAEGAHSSIRDKLQIKMEGHNGLQHLMNVHFTSPGLRALLPTRPAMLYFVFNQAMVAVYVAHDPNKDEWVCQIPYFPPHQQPSDYTNSKVTELLKNTLFSAKSNVPPSQQASLIQGLRIHKINPWVMDAQVASSYFDPQFHRVMLAGDSAHRFPPAGGFGMNTGLQDAQNLAWKLAHVVHGQASPQWAAVTYNTERRKIATENTVLSMRNYDKTLAISAALGLDADMAKVAVKSTDALLPTFMKKSVFNYAMQTALATLKGMENYSHDGGNSNVYANIRIKALQRIIQDKRSLPLIFPREDIAFTYHNKTLSTANHGYQVGVRIPHKWMLLSAGRDKSHCILSLVDLPQVCYNLKSKMQQGQKGNTIALAPPILVLASEDIQFAILDGYRSLPKERQQLVMIAIIHRKEKLCDPDGVVENLLGSVSKYSAGPSMKLHAHDRLQAQLQLPLFNIQKHTLPTNIIHDKNIHLYNNQLAQDEKQEEVKNMHRVNYEHTAALLRTAVADGEENSVSKNKEHWQQYVSKVGDVAVLRLYDVAESWFQEDRVGVVSIRPDGHIHSVLPHSSRIAHSDAMNRYLHSVTQLLTL